MTAAQGQQGLAHQQFGRYWLESIVGRGAVGEVYRAVDGEKDRTVALKVLAPQFAADDDFRARFQRESRLVAKLTNPHVVPVHDFGEIDGRLYLDMRLIDGRDLGALLAQDGPMTPERAVDLVGQVASALAAAHGQGLLHRDVKPSNVLTVPTEVGNGDFAYLSDFGVARSVGGHGATAISGNGSTFGTLEYMAPERFSSDDLDHRVDIYALGCVLFECLTGTKPYRARGLSALMDEHVRATIPRPSGTVSSVPAALDEVVVTAMAKKPADRYPTMGIFATACKNALMAGKPATDSTVPPIPTPRPAPEEERRTPTPGPTGAPSGPHGTVWHVPPDQGTLPWGTYPSPPYSTIPPTGPFGTPPPGGAPHFGPYPYGPPEPVQRRKRPWLLPVAIVAAVVLLLTITGVALLVGASQSRPTAAPPGPVASPPTSAPMAVESSTRGYTVSSMFGTPANGTCSPMTERQVNEIDGIVCNRGGPISSYYVQFSGAADTYLNGLRNLYPGMTYLAEDDCAVSYRATNIGRNNVPYHQNILIYKNSPFAAIWLGPQNSVSFQQLVDEPYFPADEKALCGR